MQPAGEAVPSTATAEFQKNLDWRAYLSDGLHLTPRGNAALHHMLQRLIDTQLPQIKWAPQNAALH